MSGQSAVTPKFLARAAAICCVVFAVFAILVGFMGISSAKQMGARVAVMYNDGSRGVALCGNVSAGFQKMRVALRNVLLSKDMTGKRRHMDELDECEAYLRGAEAIHGLTDTFKDNPARTDEIGIIEAKLDDYTAVAERITGFSLAGMDAEALAMLNNEAERAAEEFSKVAGVLSDDLNDSARRMADDSTAVKKFKALILANVGLSVGMCIIIVCLTLLQFSPFRVLSTSD